MIIKSKFDHFIFLYKIKEKMIYAINKIPCGMPKSLTSQTLLNKYLRGTPIKSKIIYDKPSKRATFLNKDIIYLKAFSPVISIPVISK